MNQNDRFVNVIIPTYKDWDLLKLCLDALRKQTYPQELFNVLVVNNDAESTFDDRFEIAENVTILNEKKPGSYAARNKALQYADGKYVGFTDSDCIPDANWIKNAVEMFENSPETDRIGGRMKMFCPNDKTTLGDLYDQTFAFPQKDYVRGGFAVTGNLFVRRKLFDTVGLFDDNLMSGGDSKWGLTAKDKGFNIVYSDDIFVNHPTRSSIRELKIKTIRIGKGLRKVFKDEKKPKFLSLIYIYIRFNLKRFYQETKMKNPTLNSWEALKVSLLHSYLLFLRDVEKYKS